ncbi:MAG TPA: hypothetical protein VFK69_13710, partial [Candidatus Eisenbacteria bacterium]|nr:hypothetical protein [Candidatus Eisenbacteria bacterium]
LAWPAWALVWWLRGAPRTGGGALETSELARDAVAALAHLAQTAAGLEWRAGDPTRGLRLGLALLLPALALVIAALALMRRMTPPRASGGVLAGAAWAVLGALPVTFVAPIWSGYYYLFALCGVALLLGALLARARWGWAAVALAALAFGSNTARQLDEFSFARSAWAGESHVNRFYIARAGALMARYLAQLRAMHPSLPPGSTVLFAHLPAFAGLQSADGPVLRWAYRDSSLRSYYLSGFAAAHGRPGPLYLFTAHGDSLSELPMDDDELRSIVLSTMLNDDVAASRDACDRLLARHPDERQAHYWSAWLAWERGDRAGAEAELRRAGVEPTASRAPEVAAALARLAARDTAGAVALLEPAVENHPLDPNAHALLADLYVGRPQVTGGASVESFAARVLAPDDARAWWRWGYLQARNERYEQAAHSLEHALTLGLSPGDAAAVRRMLDELQTVLPGSAAAREELRTTARRARR